MLTSLRFNWIDAMELLLRVLLVLIYLVWLPVMLMSRALGHDPLQLRKPAAASYWLVRRGASTRESYFSQASRHEGRPTRREGRRPVRTSARPLHCSPGFFARWPTPFFAPTRRRGMGAGCPSES
jgi:hypothetical protein